MQLLPGHLVKPFGMRSTAIGWHLPQFHSFVGPDICFLCHDNATCLGMCGLDVEAFLTAAGFAEDRLGHVSGVRPNGAPCRGRSNHDTQANFGRGGIRSA